MDPLSIIASTAAILTIITKTLVTLDVFINDSVNANQTLSELQSDLRTLHGLVDLIRGFLQTPTINDGIRTIQQDSQINLECLERALQNCERDVQKLSDILSDLNPRTGNAIRQGILQYRLDQRARDISRIKQNLQDHKCSIQVTVQLLTLFNQMQVAERDALNANEFKDKIAKLQTAIEAMAQQISRRKIVPGDEEQTKILGEMEEIRSTSVKVKRAATMHLDRMTSIIEDNEHARAGRTPIPKMPPRPPPRANKPKTWAPILGQPLDQKNGGTGPGPSSVSPPVTPSMPKPRRPPPPPPPTPPISTPASPESVHNDKGLSTDQYTPMSFEKFEDEFSALLKAAALQDMGVRKPFAEDMVTRVSGLLSRVGKQSWSERPRTYLVLRLIGEVKSMDAFEFEGLKDIDFPYTKSTLPDCIVSSHSRECFLQKQKFVLWNPRLADLVQGGRHHHLDKSADTYFTVVKKLGHGGFSVVDQVRSKLTLQDYARKKIERASTFAKDRKSLVFFENEIHNLKRLEHQHLVKFVGSYTDRKYVGIIMTPVADMDLRRYLAKTSWTPDELGTLRSFFGCLSAAVAYLHENNCRHKDLKPHNILVKGDMVYIADFGLARDWTESGRETTVGRPDAYTDLYAAPEVVARQSRNSASDIWSLGCIFLEIVTILYGKTIEDREEYFELTGSGSVLYWENQEALRQWLRFLSSTGTEDPQPLAWIQAMTAEDPKMRPKADKLVEQIIQTQEERNKYCGTCCNDDAGSDDTSWEGSASGDDFFEAPESVTLNTTISSGSTQIPPISSPRRSISETQTRFSELETEGTPSLTTPKQPHIIRRHTTDTQKTLFCESPLNRTIETIDSPPPGAHASPATYEKYLGDDEQTAVPKDDVDDPEHHTSNLVAMSNGSHTYTSAPNLRAVHVPKDVDAEDDVEEISPIEPRLKEEFMKNHKAFEDLLVQLRGGQNTTWKDKLISCITPTTQDLKGYNLLLVANKFSNDSLARDVVELVVQSDRDLVNLPNVFNNTAIHYAAAKDRPGLIKYLVSNGAKHDAVNLRKQTPLHVAVREQSAQAVKFLLRYSTASHINAVDDTGKTALHLAIRAETPTELVKDLLEAGADPNLRDNAGETPIKLSEIILNFEVMELLHPEGVEEVMMRCPPPIRLGSEAVDLEKFTGQTQVICQCETCRLYIAMGAIPGIESKSWSACLCTIHFTLFQQDMLGDTPLLESTLLSCMCQMCVSARDVTGILSQSVLPPLSGCPCSTCKLRKESNPYGGLPGSPLGRSPFSPFDPSSPRGLGGPSPFGLPPLPLFGRGPYPPRDPYDIPPYMPPPFPAYDRSPFGPRDPFGAPPLPPYDNPFAPGKLPEMPALPEMPYPGHEYYDALIESESTLALMQTVSEPYGPSGVSSAINTLSNAGFRGKNSYRNNPEKALTWAMANCLTVENIEEVVKILLDSGARVDTTDKDGCTCLHIAARHGKIALAQLLISRKAKIDPPRNATLALKSAFTPLRYALFYQQDLLMRVLLKAGANINDQSVWTRRTLLHEAIYQYSIIGMHVPLLLAHEARTDLLDSTSSTPLHVAVMEGHTSAVIMLLDAGANIESIGKGGAKPLALAIEAGHIDIVRLLVSRGADVHTRCPGNLPCALFLAVQKGNGAIVEVLLKDSPAVDDIRRTDVGGRTVLHLLAHSSLAGIMDIMTPLILYGADVNAEDRLGSTPLHEAARVGSAVLVNELLASGATLHPQNRQGKTPLDLAQDKKHREVVEFLGGSLKKKGWFRRG